MKKTSKQAAEVEEIKQRIFDVSTAYLVLFTENEHLKEENVELRESMDAIMRARDIENRYWEAMGGRK